MSKQDDHTTTSSIGVVVDHHHSPPSAPPQPYGTFQGVANYPPPRPPPPQQPQQQPVIGFPQPVPPPGPRDPTPHQYYAHGYQTVPGYAVAEGRPVREQRLSCCGIGIGWFLFIIGFFLGAIPWYAGLIILLCGRARMDPREKPGYVACTIAAILATIAIIFGITRASKDWD